MSVAIYPTVNGAAVEKGDMIWQIRADFRCCVRGRDGRTAYFDEAACSVRAYRCGVGQGVSYRLSGFKGFERLAIEARIWVETATDDVRYELIPLCDDDVADILWPAPFEMESADGCSVLPLMQGCLLRNFEGGAGRMQGDVEPCSRGMTMRFFAQYDARGGYVMLADSLYDSGLRLDAQSGESVRVSIRHLAQLGRVGRERSLRMKLMAPGADYNDAAMLYRAYIKERGELITLREKIARNPKVAEYIGIPICHTVSYVHIEPASAYYRADQPEHNDHAVTFDEIGARLKRLRGMGVEKLCLHLDGWQRRGYDNLHPDALPPAEIAGGWDGLVRLSDLCHRLGYFFGIHDQYRDYYYDCDSFDLENAARRLDGGYPEISEWYGGRQTVLCAKKAVDYVRRNYNAMAERGVLPDNAYLDVFSVVELDECDNPAHRMTREECAQARAACFNNVSSRGVVLQSEEAVDWAIPYMDFVHHAPYATEKDWYTGGFIGRAVPLEQLVYHDCLMMPLFAQKGGFGIPADVDGGLMSLLYGSGTYIADDAGEAAIERMKAITAWQKKVQLKPMLRHAFLGGRRERCEFEGGCSAEVDFETGDYTLVEGKA